MAFSSSSSSPQVVINPNYEVAESDYTNNIMKCRSRYDGQRMWTYNCLIGGKNTSRVRRLLDPVCGSGVVRNFNNKKKNSLKQMIRERY